MLFSWYGFIRCTQCYWRSFRRLLQSCSRTNSTNFLIHSLKTIHTTWWKTPTIFRILLALCNGRCFSWNVSGNIFYPYWKIYKLNERWESSLTWRSCEWTSRSREKVLSKILLNRNWTKKPLKDSCRNFEKESCWNC